MEYFHRRMEFEYVVGRMQEMGLPEGDLHPAPRDRGEAVRLWRAALVAQILLPAPRQDCVTWKKSRLAIGEIERAGMTRERAQNVIDGDIAFLAAHPTRKSIPMSNERKEERRKFKEAMRRRIKDIAASRDIPDDEIRPVLSLKHRHIGAFATKYSVNLEWLIEGKGRIFKKDLPRLSPNMTGDKFAAVVSTLPMADQQAISDKMRELLQNERDRDAVTSRARGFGPALTPLGPVQARRLIPAGFSFVFAGRGDLFALSFSLILPWRVRSIGRKIWRPIAVRTFFEGPEE